MANDNAPYGFGEITRTGSSFIGSLNRYHIAGANGTIMAVGDPVVSSGGSDSEGVPGVNRATPGDAVRGYIVGFLPLDRSQEDLPNLRPANVETYVMVADDPGGRFVIQEDSDGGALTSADVGLNVNFVITNANANTGRSQAQIDSSSALTTNTLPLKLLELYQIEGNEFGANAQWVCSFNTHELKADTGSTGV